MNLYYVEFLILLTLKKWRLKWYVLFYGFVNTNSSPPQQTQSNCFSFVLPFIWPSLHFICDLKYLCIFLWLYHLYRNVCFLNWHIPSPLILISPAAHIHFTLIHPIYVCVCILVTFDPFVSVQKSKHVESFIQNSFMTHTHASTLYTHTFTYPTRNERILLILF